MIETVLGFFQGRAIGFAGIGAILFIAFLFSKNRFAINYRIVLSAFALQAAIAFLVLRTPFGVGFIKTLSGGVTTILSYANEGINMRSVVGKVSDAFRKAGGEDFFTVAEVVGKDPHAAMADYTDGENTLSAAYSFDFIGAEDASAALLKSACRFLG